MLSRILRLTILAAAISVLVSLVGIACGGGEPEELTIPVKIAGDKLDPGKIKAGKDDMLTLQIETDKAGTIHFHTYDIEVDVTPGEVTEVFFVANQEGQFRVTFHEKKEHTEGDEHEEEGHEEEEEIEVGRLEIRP